MLKLTGAMAGAAFVASLVTCQAVSPEPPAVVRRDVVSPVSTVYASSDMAPACRMATLFAVRHLVDRGARIDLVWVPEDHRAVSLEPHVGQVAVRAGVPSDPSELATSYLWRTPTRSVLRAEIVVAHCDVAVIAHHLAHALGRERQVDYETLMHAIKPVADWGDDPIQRTTP